MTILIATGLYPPESGGPATYTRLLEERLPLLGIEVRVLPFSTVRHLPKGIKHIVYFWKCLNIARSVDVVYAQDTVSVGLPAVLAAVFARKPFLVRVAGDYAWEQGRQRFGVHSSLDDFQGERGSFAVGLLRAVQEYVVRHATKVIVPSKYLRDITLRWGVPRDRIALIYNGVELPPPTQAPKLRPEGFLLVSVGRLVPWKGMEGLIRCVAKEKDWQVVLVGDGPQEQELRALTFSLGCEKRVHFTGRLSRQEALGWVAAADVFVLNSSYEGLSHLLIEAMALGACIVTSRSGGNPELVRSGIEGLLVPAGEDDALLAALENVEHHPEEAEERAKAARIRAREFSIDTTLREISALFKTI